MSDRAFWTTRGRRQTKGGSVRTRTTRSQQMKTVVYLSILGGLVIAAAMLAQQPDSDRLPIYDVGHLKPLDSQLKIKVGDKAPDFTLRAVKGGEVSLKDFRDKKNVVISFVPAAFTPVCSVSRSTTSPRSMPGHRKWAACGSTCCPIFIPMARLPASMVCCAAMEQLSEHCS